MFFYCIDVWPSYASYLSFEIVREISSGKRFVRTIVNDEIKSVFLGQSSNNGDDKKRPMDIDQSDEEWYSYDMFVDKLKYFSLTEEQYHSECDVPLEEHHLSLSSPGVSSAMTNEDTPRPRSVTTGTLTKST